jgi:hypothetical protein
MNLILSNQASKRLKQSVEPQSDFVPNLQTWRIDCHDLRKRGIFIISNELSLYTYISSYKDGLKGILEKLLSSSHLKRVNSSEVYYLKFNNRSIIGSLTNMKAIITKMDQYFNCKNERFEKAINQTKFKYLSDKTPSEVHRSYLSS